MKRPFCTIGGCFLVASFLASFLDIRTQAVCLTACVLAFFIVLFYLKREVRMALCVGTFSAALAFAFFLPNTISDQAVTSLDEQNLTITAEVLQVTQRDGGKYTYLVEVKPDDGEISRPFWTLVYTNRSIDADEADLITLPVRFYLPDSTEYFDGQRYYRSDHINILSYFNGKGAVSVQAVDQETLLTKLYGLNRFLSQKAEEAFSESASPAFQSMLLGNREDISFAVQQKYSDAGVVHILVISGMHISILAFAVLGAMKVLRVRRRISIMVTVGAVLFFVLLSGAGLSAVRAGCMVILMLAGRLFYRKVDSVNSLCCAGFFIVLCDIYAIMDVGFLMSFLSTLGILICATPLQNWVCRKLGLVSRMSETTVGTLSVTLSANLFLLPVYFFTFGSMSLVSPVTNLITAATSSFIIVLGMPVLILWMIPGCGKAAFVLCRIEEWLIGIQNGAAEWFGSLRFATIGLDYEVFFLWFLLSVLVFFAVVLFRNRVRLYRAAVVFCVSLFMLCSSLNLLSLRDVLRIAVVSDGTTSNVIVIDQFRAAILSPADDDYIDEATFRYLKKKGIQEIDTMFILYPAMEEYQDTLDLVSVFPTQNLLYHPDNVACGQIMEGKAEESLPLGGVTEWKLDLGAEGVFRYHSSGMCLEMNYKDRKIVLCNAKDELLDSPADLCLVSGKTTDLTGIPGEMVVLLERQWDRVTTDQDYLTAEQSVLEFEIGTDGVLRRIT